MEENNFVSGEVTTVKKTSKNKKVIIIIISVIAALLAGYFAFISFFVTSEKVYEVAINEAFNTLNETTKIIEENLIEDTSKINKSVITGTFDITSNISGLDKANINYELGINAEDEVLALNATIDDELDIALSYFENYLYIISEDIYDSPLYMFIEENIVLEIPETNFDFKDIYEVIDSSNKAFTNAITEFDIKSDDKTIELDGDKTDVTAHILELNNDDIEKLFKTIIDNLNDNNDFLKSMANLTGMEKEDIKDLLDNSKDQIVLEEEIELEYIIYTSGLLKEYVGFDIDIMGETLFTSRVEDDKTIYEIPVLKDIFSLETTKDTIELDYDDTMTKFELFFEKDNNTKFNYKINYSDNMSNFEMDGSYNNKVSKDAIDTDIKLDIEATLDGEEYILEMTSNFKLETDKIVDIDETVDAINIDELSNDELTEINTNLENALEKTFIMDLVTEFSEYLSSITSDLNTEDTSTDNYYYTDESLFTANANVILEAAEYALDDLNSNCVTVEYLIENDYITGLPSTYKGTVTYEDYIYYIAIHDTATGFKIDTYSYVLESDIDESLTILETCSTI